MRTFSERHSTQQIRQTAQIHNAWVTRTHVSLAESTDASQKLVHKRQVREITCFEQPHRIVIYLHTNGDYPLQGLFLKWTKNAVQTKMIGVPKRTTKISP